VAQRIFLSYRRSDTALQAIALKIVLERKLPNISVFVDTESINPSERWPERLAAALEDASAVMALIGPRWRYGPDGTDRFVDPEDWVLREVAYALENKEGAFIPVLFDTTPEAAYRDPPPNLAGMRAIHSHGLARGGHWEQDVDRLAILLARILGTDMVDGTIRFPKPSELKKRAPRLTEAEFDEHKLEMAALEGWAFSRVPISTPGGEVQGTEISRTFTFTNFKRAFTFMALVAELAESRPHHPDWTNVWNSVCVRLRTFDAGQSVTWYDIEMACAMHEIAAKVADNDNISWPLRPASDG
jgi:4a-hydroxytetrahydrobiopterin dehydratase